MNGFVIDQIYIYASRSSPVIILVALMHRITKQSVILRAAAISALGIKQSLLFIQSTLRPKDLHLRSRVHHQEGEREREEPEPFGWPVTMTRRNTRDDA